MIGINKENRVIRATLGLGDVASSRHSEHAGIRSFGESRGEQRFRAGGGPGDSTKSGIRPAGW